MTVETENELDEKKQGQVSDYLQGPRKKRKDYVVLALGRNFDPDLASAMEIFVRQSFPQYAVSVPKDMLAIKRLQTRQFALIVLDDHFAKTSECLEMVKEIKSRRNMTTPPVLFLTDNARVLIEEYHRVLLPYQEMDNYVLYRGIHPSRICARIHTALTQKRSRRSRRNAVGIPVKYFHLTKDRLFEGEVTEISMHGGILSSAQAEIFRVNDQLRLHIPTYKYLPPEQGEFMRLSAKVRRVLIGGDTVGLSWEYLSESQNLQLLRYVTEVINSQLHRLSAQQRSSQRLKNQ